MPGRRIEVTLDDPNSWEARAQIDDRISRVLEEQKTAESEAATSSLSDYRRMLQDVPIPTKQQRKNFARFVAHAHSWYKHLPLYEPGVPFQFYLDKYSACDRVVTDGQVRLVERMKRGFHYSDIPTEEYRRRFGYLTYSCDAGTTVVAAGREGPIVTPRDSAAVISGDGAQIYGLPSEICDVGIVRLTAVIHSYSGGFGWWDQRFDSKYSDRVRWPEESGGQATLDEIFARCRVMREPSFGRERWIEKTTVLTTDGPIEIDGHKNLRELDEEARQIYGNPVDSVLHELLIPERKRQYGEMVRAMDRVCDIVEGRAQLSD